MITLYEAFVPTAVQLLGSVDRLLTKAEAHCSESGRTAQSVIGARLAPDMLDLSYQVKSCAGHSLGAIEGLRKGNYSPDMSTPADSFAALRDQVAGAIEGLARVTVEEMEALQDKPMTFTMRDIVRWDFTAKDFLLSFSQPNFNFHVAATYAILRADGLPIGKRDYLGKLRMSQPA
ncbi:DUF1993 family protein [Blastomonas sp.]|uniref:DUF1993 domain-containing protein n=1 Tax=Blastomonas sp. TaxID=1909299 RepID=UPI00262F6604|nr:DUF1993 domain-containing protein [Blastomonas sp.]MDM7957948.1 DUF1993 domain-containing protein [Blastomonas sp.]